MIDNSIWPIDQVVQDMQTFWPSKKTDHRKIALKYYDLVKRAITRGVNMADTESVKLNLIPVSFKQIRDQLGRYGSRGQEQYWFDWFQEHHALMEPVVRGYSLPNKKYSLTMIKTTREIERLLAYSTDQELFDSYYADLKPEEVDLVTIDLDSLAAYVAHNQDSQKFNSNNTAQLEKLKQNEKTALLILRLAHYNKGLLPQIKVISPFGRKYYKGPNLQSAAKIVRHAALGRCYQYDIEASVFTWKLCIAKDIDPSIKLPETIEYLDFKDHHRKRLALLLFENDQDYSVATVKQVITAVGFGARINSAASGWYSNGQWTTSAVSDIIKSPKLRKQLFNDTWFKAFVAEQDLMNTLIFDQVKELLKDKTILQTDSGRLSKNKAISFLYQQAEAQIIKALDQRLQVQGKQMLLLCHDGFYTKTPADLVDLRYELQQHLAQGRLDQEQHKPFKYNPEAVIDENQHRHWIAQEEQAVALRLGKSLHQPRKLRLSLNARNEDYDDGYDDGTKAYQEPNYSTELHEQHQVEVNQLPNDILEMIYSR